jgi:hypothetical protein
MILSLFHLIFYTADTAGLQAHTPNEANLRTNNETGYYEELSVAQSFTNMTISGSVAQKSFKTLQQAKGGGFLPTVLPSAASGGGGFTPSAVSSAASVASSVASPGQRKVFEPFHFDMKLPFFVEPWKDENGSRRTSIGVHCLSGTREVPFEVVPPGSFVHLYHKLNQADSKAQRFIDEIVSHQRPSEQDKTRSALKYHGKKIYRNGSVKKMNDLMNKNPYYTQKICLPFKCSPHVVSKEHDDLFYGKRFFEGGDGSVYYFIELIESGEDDACDPHCGTTDFGGEEIL